MLDLEAGVLEDGDMVAPCWRWQVDVLAMWVKSLEESSTNSESTSSGDRLSDGNLFKCSVSDNEFSRPARPAYAVVLDLLAVLTVRENRGMLCEFRETSNWQVLLVVLRFHDVFVCLRSS